MVKDDLFSINHHLYRYLNIAKKFELSIMSFLFILGKIYLKFPVSPLQKIPIVCC